MASLDGFSVELIVTADDFGVCEERNRGIIHCLKHGIVSATSVMCNAPAAATGLAAIALLGPEVCDVVGLHLNLTEGAPLAPVHEVGSLLRPEFHEPTESSAPWERSAAAHKGPCFLGKLGFSRACAAGIVETSHVVREARAQVEWFRGHTGRVPTHVDGHQHCHVEPNLAEGLAVLFAEYGINVVRIPEEHGYDHLDTFCSRCRDVQVLAQSARAVYTSYGIASPQAFLGCSLCGLAYTPVDFLQALDKQVAFLRSHATQEHSSRLTIEAMCHPGFSAPGQWDEFTSSADRSSEMRTLCDPQLRKAIAARGVLLCAHLGC